MHAIQARQFVAKLLLTKTEKLVSWPRKAEENMIRSGGGGYAGCAAAHPIFCSLFSQNSTIDQKNGWIYCRNNQYLVASAAPDDVLDCYSNLRPPLEIIKSIKNNMVKSNFNMAQRRGELTKLEKQKHYTYRFASALLLSVRTNEL